MNRFDVVAETLRSLAVSRHSPRLLESILEWDICNQHPFTDSAPDSTSHLQNLAKSKGNPYLRVLALEHLFYDGEIESTDLPESYFFDLALIAVDSNIIRSRLPFFDSLLRDGYSIDSLVRHLSTKLIDHRLFIEIAIKLPQIAEYCLRANSPLRAEITIHYSAYLRSKILNHAYLLCRPFAYFAWEGTNPPSLRALINIIDDQYNTWSDALEELSIFSTGDTQALDNFFRQARKFSSQHSEMTDHEFEETWLNSSAMIDARQQISKRFFC